jgi:hypothetical protein
MGLQCLIMSGGGRHRVCVCVCSSHQFPTPLRYLQQKDISSCLSSHDSPMPHSCLRHKDPDIIVSSFLFERVARGK